MQRRLTIIFILFFITIGLASAQTDNKAADKNTWHVAGLGSAYYLMPTEEDGYTEEGALSIILNPRVLWFPIDGIGIGVDAGFHYFIGYFTDYNISIGPRMAYYLKRPGLLSQLMPYAGCSFQYLLNDIDPGATETGWNMKLGLGISPVFGGQVTVPIEIGYMTHHLSSDYGSNSFSHTWNRIYLEVGIGVFLWKEDHP